MEITRPLTDSFLNRAVDSRAIVQPCRPQDGLTRVYGKESTLLMICRTPFVLAGTLLGENAIFNCPSWRTGFMAHWKRLSQSSIGLGLALVWPCKLQATTSVQSLAQCRQRS